MKTPKRILFVAAFGAISTLTYALDVNLNTGQLEFSKNIVTVKGHSVSLPVNLNYSSRLLKYQRASWVGMGFDLGVPYIERDVSYGPDDQWGHSVDYSNSSQVSQAGIDGLSSAGATIAGTPVGSELHFSYVTYQPLVYKQKPGTGAVVFHNFFDPAVTVSSNCLLELGGAPLPQPPPPPVLPLPDRVLGYGDAFLLNTNLGILTRPREYPSSSNMNTKLAIYPSECPYYSGTSFQDRYQLNNFPGGDRQIFFRTESRKHDLSTYVGNDADSLFACVAPFAPWVVSYSIADPQVADGKNAAIDRWVIVDENGTRFIFGKKVSVVVNTDVGTGQPAGATKMFDEAQQIWKTSGDNPSWPASTTRPNYTVLSKHSSGAATWRWYLDSMYTYDGEKIAIEYENIGAVTLAEPTTVSEIRKWEYGQTLTTTTTTVSEAGARLTEAQVAEELRKTEALRILLDGLRPGTISSDKELPKAKLRIKFDIHDMVMNIDMRAVSCYAYMKNRPDLYTKYGVSWFVWPGTSNEVPGFPMGGCQMITPWSDWVAANMVGTSSSTDGRALTWVSEYRGESWEPGYGFGFCPSPLAIVALRYRIKDGPEGMVVLASRFNPNIGTEDPRYENGTHFIYTQGSGSRKRESNGYKPESEDVPDEYYTTCEASAFGTTYYGHVAKLVMYEPSPYPSVLSMDTVLSFPTDIVVRDIQLVVVGANAGWDRVVINKHFDGVNGEIGRAHV